MLIDLSHTVEDGMITYKGLPAPIVCDYLSREASRKLYAPGTEFQIGKIEMVANTGTYLDSPFHRYADGKDLSELSLDRLANLEAVVVRWDPGKGVRSAPRYSIAGRCVARQFSSTPAGRPTGGPTATSRVIPSSPETLLLISCWQGRLSLGIDSYNIDDTGDLTRPVHSRLLRDDIPIVEHMAGLDRLPDVGSRFFAVPVKVKGMGTFPVRAFWHRGGGLNLMPPRVSIRSNSRAPDQGTLKALSIHHLPYLHFSEFVEANPPLIENQNGSAHGEPRRGASRPDQDPSRVAGSALLCGPHTGRGESLAGPSVRVLGADQPSVFRSQHTRQAWE